MRLFGLGALFGGSEHVAVPRAFASLVDDLGEVVDVVEVDWAKSRNSDGVERNEIVGGQCADGSVPELPSRSKLNALDAVLRRHGIFTASTDRLSSERVQVDPMGKFSRITERMAVGGQHRAEMQMTRATWTECEDAPDLPEHWQNSAEHNPAVVTTIEGRVEMGSGKSLVFRLGPEPTMQILRAVVTARQVGVEPPVKVEAVTNALSEHNVEAVITGVSAEILTGHRTSTGPYKLASVEMTVSASKVPEIARMLVANGAAPLTSDGSSNSDWNHADNVVRKLSFVNDLAIPFESEGLGHFELRIVDDASFRRLDSQSETRYLGKKAVRLGPPDHSTDQEQVIDLRLQPDKNRSAPPLLLGG